MTTFPPNIPPFYPAYVYACDYHDMQITYVPEYTYFRTREEAHAAGQQFCKDTNTPEKDMYVIELEEDD